MWTRCAGGSLAGRPSRIRMAAPIDAVVSRPVRMQHSAAGVGTARRLVLLGVLPRVSRQSEDLLGLELIAFLHCALYPRRWMRRHRPRNFA